MPDASLRITTRGLNRPKLPSGGRDFFESLTFSLRRVTVLKVVKIAPAARVIFTIITAEFDRSE